MKIILIAGMHGALIPFPSISSIKSLNSFQSYSQFTLFNSHHFIAGGEKNCKLIYNVQHESWDLVGICFVKLKAKKHLSMQLKSINKLLFNAFKNAHKVESYEFIPLDLPPSDVPIAALYESGVLCVKPEYIAEFLICVETPPDTDKFLVEPVKDIMTKKRARESSFNEPGSFKRMKTEELKG